MCGIVGYVGQQEAAPILLDGLRRLEYRGYDSAGIAVCGDGQLRVKKSRGRLQVLSDLTTTGRICRAIWASVTPAGPPTGSPMTSTPTPM